jgi:hypothetical protein
MPDLVRGEANDNANPRVLFAWQPGGVNDNNVSQGGFFQPITSLSFRILDPTGAEYVGSTVVDVNDDDNVVDRTDEGGKGRVFILPFTIAGGQAVGQWTAEVTFIADPTDGAAWPSQTITFPFRVLDEAHPFVDGSYAQVQDMLDNGFPLGSPAPPGGFSFTDAARALERATALVDRITSRYFEARYREYDLDGKGGPAIQTEHAIVGLTDVAFTFTTFTPADLPIETGDLRVYNRHIRQQLLEPDDRNDPRIEFLRTPNFRFPRAQVLGEVDLLSSFIGFTESQQNVKCRGIWGYTDPDGSPFGKTPELIVEATLRIAASKIQPLWSAIGGAGSTIGSTAAGPILEEKTLDQQVKFADVASSNAANNAYVGNFTGDPAIDQILAMYMAPPKYRSA